MASTDVNERAQLVAHYILVGEIEKFGIKKSDVVNKVLNISGRDRVSRQDVDEIMERASSILETTLGFRLLLLQNKNVYILVNNLDFEHLEKFLDTNEDEEQIRGLLCVILASIMMIGDELPENDLMSFLRDIDVDKDDKHHPTFGDVGKLMSRFVKQHYLDYNKGKRSDPTYSWGLRAHQEFEKMDILSFVAKIYDDGRDAKDFTSVYKRIQNELVNTSQTSTEQSLQG